MIRNIVLTAGVVVFSVLTAGTITFAQTETPNSPTPTGSISNINPSPTTTIPGGAPATGKGK